MKSPGLNEQQLQKMNKQPGFIAALDQSGGSTPGALRHYGIKEDAWSNEDEMFAIVHQMRTRIMISPAFTGDPRCLTEPKPRASSEPRCARSSSKPMPPASKTS